MNQPVVVDFPTIMDGYVTAWRRSAALWRLAAARFAYVGAVTGASLTETPEERNVRITDARDRLYTARDLTEEPR